MSALGGRASGPSERASGPGGNPGAVYTPDTSMDWSISMMGMPSRTG